jgi:hypothetical protein
MQKMDIKKGGMTVTKGMDFKRCIELDRRR